MMRRLFLEHLEAWLALLVALIGALSAWRLQRKPDPIIEEKKRAYADFYKVAREREQAWSALPLGLAFGADREAMQKAINIADSGGLEGRFDLALSQVKVFGSDRVVAAALKVEECFDSFAFNVTCDVLLSEPDLSLVKPLQQAMFDYEVGFRRDIGAGKAPLRRRT